MKKLLTACIGLTLFASSCGSATGDASTSSEGTTRNETGTTAKDDDLPTTSSEDTTQKESNKKWQRTQTNAEIQNYKPAEIIEVVDDPEDPQTVLVHFEMGAEPCSGAKATAIETDDAVTIALEVGLHKNVAAMTCVNTTISYELAVSLEKPLGERDLQTAKS